MTAAADGVSAWSVSGNTLNSEDVASTLFAVSLFPYLAFLYFLGRPSAATPPLGNFGFKFLLFFVFATIPAGIYAKLQYHDILANVDWLHGTAESMLTITNLFIILGFRATRPKPSSGIADAAAAEATRMADLAIPIMLVLAALSFLHPEPTNALSIPTWMVHSSSLLEWLLAMKLIWEHAETSGNPRWKGMTWAMIPSHTSGICACTYHFFYNAPVLTWIVSLQAGLTVVGNLCLALAAYRISQYSPEQQQQEQETRSPKVLEDDDAGFAFDMFVKTVAVAVAVKYGELALELPFLDNPSWQAVTIITLPTLANVGKWAIRSRGDSAEEKLFIL